MTTSQTEAVTINFTDDQFIATLSDGREVITPFAPASHCERSAAISFSTTQSL